MVTYKIELEDSGGTTRDFVTESDRNVSALEVVREHTALSDFEATAHITDYDTVESLIGPTTEVFIEVNGDLIFRGYASRLEGEEESGEATLSGPDMFDRLRRDEREIIIENEAVDRAIDQYWDNTDFSGGSGSHSVVSPSVSTTATDSGAIFLSSNSAWEGATGLPDATKPFEVIDGGTAPNDELAVQQTSFTVEAEDTDDRISGGGTATDPVDVFPSDFSDQTGVALGEEISEAVVYSFTPKYDITDFDVAFRKKYQDNGGTTVGVTIDIVGGEYSGKNIATFSGTSTTVDWEFASNKTGNNTDDITLSAGTTYDIQFISNDTSSDRQLLDVIQPHDATYNYTRDNTLDSNDYLRGPGYYPNGIQFSGRDPGAKIELKQWPNFSVSAYQNDNSRNIFIAQLDNSDWADSNTTGAQQVAFSNDNGTTYRTLDNTTSGFVTFNTGTPETYGATLTTRLRMGGYGTNRGATPTENYKPHAVFDIDVNISTDDRSFIEGERFTGSDFEILQQLHERANYRWSGDYDRSELNVDSFPRGTNNGDTSNLVVKDRTRVLDTEGYANEVTVEGRIRNADNPDPVRQTVTDTSEVVAKGETITKFIKDTRVVRRAGAKVRERQALIEALKNEELRGELTIAPQNIRPGYQYTVSAWNEDLDLETVVYTERFNAAEGRLRFETIPRLDEKTSQQRIDLSEFSRSL